MNRKLVPTNQRMQQVNALFGSNFPFQLEPLIYNFATNMADDYNGGYWEFFILDNDGFYIAPGSGGPFKVCCTNGYEGTLSADALGITGCLYAYSLLSFERNDMAKVYASHYHLLHEYMLDHDEAEDTLKAID